jgi:lysozyme
VTLFFRDVSHYDGAVSLAGQLLVIAKASQGITNVDQTYIGHRVDAARAGVRFGAYHWVDTSDLQGQAVHAHTVIGSVPAMWDCEAAGATVGRILDLTARYRALGGVVHLCYLPHWWWQHLGSPDLRPLAAAGLALVSSNYPAGGYSDTGPGWAAYGGVSPTVWQYTSTPHDSNAYRGSVDQLWALMTGGNPTSTGGTTVADPTVEALMNRTINNRRVADILGEEDGANNTIAAMAAMLVEVDSKLDAVLAAVKALDAPVAPPGVPAAAGPLSITLTGTAVPTPAGP